MDREFEGDDEVPYFVVDPEALHPGWSEALPGVEYVPGGLEAAKIAVEIRRFVRQCIKTTDLVNRVIVTQRSDGVAIVRLDMVPPAGAEVLEFLVAGARARGLWNESDG